MKSFLLPILKINENCMAPTCSSNKLIIIIIIINEFHRYTSLTKNFRAADVTTCVVTNVNTQARNSKLY